MFENNLNLFILSLNPKLFKFNNSIIMQLLLIMMSTKHEYVARIDLLIPSKIIPHFFVSKCKRKKYECHQDLKLSKI